MKDPKKLGVLAENMAKTFLLKRGYKILEQNYKKPWGEIDIIAQKDDVFIFVEVKASRLKFSIPDYSPELRVNYKKLQKILKTAQFYLDSGESKWRLDVIGVMFYENKKGAKITHFKNVADNFY